MDGQPEFVDPLLPNDCKPGTNDAARRAINPIAAEDPLDPSSVQTVAGLVEDSPTVEPPDPLSRLDRLLAPAPARVADGRPILLLDVDGVLNIFPEEDQRPVGFRQVVLPRVGRLCLSADHGTWLNELSASFELVWATSWEHQAARYLGPRLGLPPMRVVEMDYDNLSLTRKLSSVIAFVGDRPCAWIDDVLLEDAVAWAAARQAPTMLIQTDPRTGLTRRDVERLHTFAAACAANDHSPMARPRSSPLASETPS